MQGHSVSLRFRSTEQCTFDREETRELESRTKHVREKTSIFGDIFSGTAQKTTVTNKVLWPSLHALMHPHMHMHIASQYPSLQHGIAVR